MESRNVTIWAMMVVLCLASSPALALIEFKDGGTHNIDYEINDSVRIDHGCPGMGTTVNVYNGGLIAFGHYVTAWEDSTVNMYGGLIVGGLSSGLSGAGRSIVNIYGGVIGRSEMPYSAHVTASGWSTVNIFNGTVYGDVRALWDSTLNITGGFFSDGLYVSNNAKLDLSGGAYVHNDLHATGGSTAEISGGQMYNLFVTDNSVVSLSGGSIRSSLVAEDDSTTNMMAGTIGSSLLVGDSATIILYGSDFNVDGSAVSYGELISILGESYYAEPVRHLTGILASGDLIDNDFRIGDDARIVLIPEPATLLLLGLGAVMLRRKSER